MRPKNLSIGLLCGLVLPLVAEAQVERPPRRSKDNHHQATRPQHKRIKVLLDAWVECLSPHIASIEDHELRSRLAAELQNQYSDHAAFDFREELIRIVQEDLQMSNYVFAKKGGKALIGGGGELDPPLVEVLIGKAIETSGGALHYEHLYGTPDSLAALHQAVLQGEGSVLRRLRGALRKEGLDQQQKLAAKDLYQAYMPCFMEKLPIEGSRQTKAQYQEMFAEAFATSATDRAAAGVRSKLKGALRNHFEDEQSLESAWSLIEFDRFLGARVAELTGEEFWLDLEFHHARMLKEPGVFRREFRDFECRIGDPEGEATADPASASRRVDTRAYDG